MAELRNVSGAPAAEEALLAAIRRRDMAAFEELYRLYHPRLSRFLFKLVRRPPLVEEILNDTLMVVWSRPETFHGASRLSTWIFGIAYRTAMRALRRFDEPIESDARDEPIASERDDPDEGVRASRRHMLLLEAMSRLSPEHRAVIDLTYFHDMGYREIAAIVDCPVDTVKTRMFHARRRLRRHLDGELPDWL